MQKKFWKNNNVSKNQKSLYIISFRQNESVVKNALTLMLLSFIFFQYLQIKQSIHLK